MAGQNNSYIKKQKTEKRLKKRKEKEQKKLYRKENSAGGDFQSMIAYVDKFGNITTERPEEPVAVSEKQGAVGATVRQSEVAKSGL
jgi:S-adenosylmethionine hydrolase